MSHFKQEFGYGCGLYAIANALQDKSIITENRIAWSENGNNVGQLNRWLEQSDYDCWIGVIRYNNQEPIEIFDLVPDFDSDGRILWFPFLVVITSSQEKNHMLGCRYMRDNSIIVHDSLMEKELCFKNFREFAEEFEGRFLSFECLYSLENKAIFIVDFNLT